MLSAAVTIIAPAVEPIELAAAKQFLRIDGDAQDDAVRLLVSAARIDLEQVTSQRLIEQTVRLQATRLDDLADLAVGPVTEIVAITYRDGSGAEQSIGLEAVYLTGLGIERGIGVVPGCAWPRSVRGPVTVDLKVGYGPTGAAVPANLRHALLALIRGKYDDRAVDIAPLIVNDRL